MPVWFPRGALAGAFMTVVSGCRGAPRVQYASVDAALARVQVDTECSRSVEGDADLVISGPLYSMRGKLLYLASAPNKLRFDIYSSFGVTLSTLTSDGQRFSLYSLDENSFWYGPSKTCNLRKFTRIPLPPFALVELLRGRPPILLHQDSDAKIRFSRPVFSRGYYVVDIGSKNQASQRLTFEVPEEDWEKDIADQRLRLRSVRVEQKGSLLYEVELSEYRPARRTIQKLSKEELEMGIESLPPSGPSCSAELPGKLKFSIPGTGHSLSIENHETSHNPSISALSFTQALPGGVRSEYSDCKD